MARLSVPLGGRMKKSRAVGNHLARPQMGKVEERLSSDARSPERTVCQSESLRFFGREGGDFLGDQIAPWSENRRTYAYHCCAFGDGIIQIFRHPHGKCVEFVSILLEPIEQFPQHVELAALQGRGGRELR